MYIGVKYESHATDADIDRIEKAFGLTRIKVIKTLRVYSYRVEKDISKKLKQEDAVEYVEPSREFTPMKE
ncbi:MAG: hypothetical protein JXJ04_23375 [Spirochaetales bacterium]|nr:hypothetical protein [Spirochaetales bacterium]